MRRVIGWFLLAGSWPGLLSAELTSEESAFFEAKVRPLLIKHCYECHSREEEVKGGLRLDSREGWRAGGDSGAVIVPGNPSQSLLIESVLYTDPDLQMPPKYKLGQEEIDVLQQWIVRGAPDPRMETLPNPVPQEIDLESGRKHWAFQPVESPDPPPVRDEGWLRNDLDRFVLARIEEAGISPAPDADRFALIRRVTLDLTGLPPKVDEINAFVKDPAPDDEALSKVVERLLDSDRFGERWGRHWLDLARYADSIGRTRNLPFPFAWKYRNYVIDTFNADKPYHRFLSEQIAGDLLPAEDDEHRQELLIATGFLALGPMDLDERDNELFLLDRIDDQVDTLGRSVLALTMGCARCHDHKFDPVAQLDYYALAGIFASTETLSGLQNRGRGMGDSYTNTYLLASLEGSSFYRQAEQNKELSAARKQVLKLQADMIWLTSTREKRVNESALENARKRLSGLEERAARNRKPRSNLRVDAKAPLAMGAREGGAQDLAIRLRGEPDLHGDVVARGFPRVLVGVDEEGASEIPELESGRLELARWLSSPDHPLTSRVMANRIWSHLFGRGIVPTVDNFGIGGDGPTHPELLDYLATQFVAKGWSVKELIRLITLSRTYRLSSEHLPANAVVDEGNELFWRANLRRVEAEVIRDSLLAAGGLLDLRRPFQSPIEGLQAKELGRNGLGQIPDRVFEQTVRSVYLPVFRSSLPDFFTVFDFADPSLVNGKRDVTTVPPQALFLLNNEFVIDVAKRGAERILRANLTDKASRIRYAYAYALCRKPTEAELARADAFIRSREDWAPFLQALFSTAEFRYVH